MRLNTIEEVGIMLNVSIISIRRYLKAGDLKGSKLVHQWRISDQQVQDFIDKYSNDYMTKKK